MFIKNLYQYINIQVEYPFILIDLASRSFMRGIGGVNFVGTKIFEIDRQAPVVHLSTCGLP